MSGCHIKTKKFLLLSYYGSHWLAELNNASSLSGFRLDFKASKSIVGNTVFGEREYRAQSRFRKIKGTITGPAFKHGEGNTVFLILPDIAEKASEGIYNAKQKS